jgi:hypothetical protein
LNDNYPAGVTEADFYDPPTCKKCDEYLDFEGKCANLDCDDFERDFLGEAADAAFDMLMDSKNDLGG